MSSAGGGDPGPASNAEPMSVPLSEDQRRTARAMAGLGVARRQIAKYLRMDEAELAARLGDELEQAEVEANSKVAKALFAMATQKNNVAAAIFWMKARGGWRERPDGDGAAREGRPQLEVQIVRFSDAIPEPTTGLTDTSASSRLSR